MAAPVSFSARGLRYAQSGGHLRGLSQLLASRWFHEPVPHVDARWHRDCWPRELAGSTP